MILCFLFCSSWLISPIGNAWNDTGHELVAQIAFDQLSPVTRIQLANILGRGNDETELEKQFLLAATWPDYIKRKDVHAFDHWHYINLAFSLDGTHYPLVDRENIVWALQQASYVLQSNEAHKDLKKMFLKFYIHFIGDIHQPLHCASLFSAAFPTGDNGGNLFIIGGVEESNLHAFWDNMADAFYRESRNGHLSFKKVSEMAVILEKEYPKHYFGAKVDDTIYYDYARESFNLAKAQVYLAKPNKNLSKEYVHDAQELTKQQICLAGYRLAKQLNQTFGANQ